MVWCAQRGIPHTCTTMVAGTGKKRVNLEQVGMPTVYGIPEALLTVTTAPHKARDAAEVPCVMLPLPACHI
jgi:hypothetical protein